MSERNVGREIEGEMVLASIGEGRTGETHMFEYIEVKVRFKTKSVWL